MSLAHSAPLYCYPSFRLPGSWYSPYLPPVQQTVEAQNSPSFPLSLLKSILRYSPELRTLRPPVKSYLILCQKALSVLPSLAFPHLLRLPDALHNECRKNQNLPPLLSYLRDLTAPLLYPAGEDLVIHQSLPKERLPHQNPEHLSPPLHPLRKPPPSDHLSLPSHENCPPHISIRPQPPVRPVYTA